MKNIMLFLALLVNFIGNAQEPFPPIDKNWEYNTIKSDEFQNPSGTIEPFDPMKWQHAQCDGWGGGQCYKDDHSYIYNNQLIMYAEPNTGQCPPDRLFVSGGIQSLNADYSYGYFEVSGQMPIGIGSFPAIWSFYQEYLGPGFSSPCGVTCNTSQNPCNWQCLKVHDEIDILEVGPCENDGTRYEAGWHDEYYPDMTQGCGHYKVTNIPVVKSYPFTQNTHIYSVLWLPGRIIFYFDKGCISAEYNDSRIPTHSQYFVMDYQIDSRWCPATLNQLWPKNMVIDYFRYYQLKYDCSSDVIICNNNALSTFNYSVKNKIVFGCSKNEIIRLNDNETYVFRASNEILIRGNFEMGSGSELFLIPTPCN